MSKHLEQLEDVLRKLPDEEKVAVYLHLAKILKGLRSGQPIGRELATRQDEELKKARKRKLMKLRKAQ